MKKLFIICLLGLVTLALLLGVTFQQLSRTAPITSDQAKFNIILGDSLTSVAWRLAKQGVVQNPQLLIAYARLTKQTNIKRGEYQLNELTSDLLLLNTLLSGDVVSRNVTFIEGMTFKQSLAVLHKQQGLIHLLAGQSMSQVAAKLNIKSEHYEGWIFPDTYQYTKGMSDLDILKIAYQRMQDVLKQQWSQREEGLPYDTPYEALIMASIIEKETGAAFERPQIAGVFVRRLQKGMRLQTDPTVIYGLGDDYQGNLRRRHLRQPTPYNTYTINGLPPTPIALPGKESINAALNPAIGDSLFFVAKGDGTHYFSVTLDEHNKAVKQYQLKRQSNYRSAPPPAIESSPSQQ